MTCTCTTKTAAASDGNINSYGPAPAGDYYLRISYTRYDAHAREGTTRDKPAETVIVYMPWTASRSAVSVHDTLGVPRDFRTRFI